MFPPADTKGERIERAFSNQPVQNNNFEVQQQYWIVPSLGGKDVKLPRIGLTRWFQFLRHDYVTLKD